MIGSLRLSEFFTEHWLRTPVVFRCHSIEPYDSLLSVFEVDELIQSIKYPNDGTLSIVDGYARPYGSDSFAAENGEGNINSQEVYRLYKDGKTLLITQMFEKRRQVALFCRGIEEDFYCRGILLRDRVGSNLYITPPRAQGLDTHFDSQHVFIVQLSGSKIWRIYEQVEENPRQSPTTPLETKKLSPLISDLRLMPGDTLYIPAGFPHDAHTLDEASAHVTFSVQPVAFCDILATISEIWAESRQPLPASLEGARAAGIDILRNLSRQFEETNLFKKSFDYLRKDFFAALGSIPAFEEAGNTEQKEEKVDIDDVFVLSPGVFGEITVFDNKAQLTVPGYQVTCNASAADALQYIIAGKEFLVRSLPNLPDGDKTVLVAKLLEARVLKRTISSPFN